METDGILIEKIEFKRAVLCMCGRLRNARLFEEAHFFFQGADGKEYDPMYEQIETETGVFDVRFHLFAMDNHYP